VPALLGPEGEGLDLRWADPQGNEYATSAVVLVSNDPYRLGRALGSGTRPRLDAGQLGIAVISAAKGDEAPDKRLEEWSAPTFEVGSDGRVAAGIDGEAAQLNPPLHFRTRPGALRVWIAPQHPGASPSATIPPSVWKGIRGLARIAALGSQ
jgi:hypothetical protein